MKGRMIGPSGVVKKVKFGFSWTTLFFGFFVPLFRGDFKWFLICLLCDILVLPWLIFPFIYNKIYIKELLERGYKPEDALADRMRSKGIIAGNVAECSSNPDPAPLPIASQQTCPAPQPIPSSQPEPVPQPIASQQTPPIAQPEAATLPDKVPGYVQKYAYYDVRAAVVDGCNPAAAFPRAYPDLVAEPDNSYDPKAVAVIFKGVKIGYLHKGKLQDMYHDFRARGGDVLARVSVASDDTLVLSIGYYEKVPTPFDKAIEGGSKYKSFRLSANAGAEMQEDISLCSADNELEYEYDPEKGKYAAACDGNTIGYFPKSAEELLENGNRAVIQSIEENDSGKYIVTVAVIL